jgi:hypothetical protein
MFASPKSALGDLLNQPQLLPLNIRAVDAMNCAQRRKATARANANVLSEYFLLLPALAFCDDLCGILNLQKLGDKRLASTR